jgi:hypothetical protein
MPHFTIPGGSHRVQNSSSNPLTPVTPRDNAGSAANTQLIQGSQTRSSPMFICRSSCEGTAA